MREILQNSSTVLSTIQSTSSRDETTEPADLMNSHPQLSAIWIFLYSVIWVVGVFGNVMVLYVVIKYKTMRNTTNIFIACLSISDLAICFFAIPFTLASALQPTWKLGVAICKLIPFILTTSVFVSTFISVTIAADRFVIILYPHHPRMNSSLQVFIIIIIAAVSATASLPVAIYSKVETIDGNVRCEEKYPNQFSQEAFNWFVITFQLIIPTIIITVCYTAIFIRLRKRTNNNSFTKQKCKIKAEAKRNRKINRMLIAMVVIFFCCWLPLDLSQFFLPLIEENTPEANNIVLYIYFTCHVLAMSSVIYNPFLYGWMNENFNKHFLKTLRCLKLKPKRCNSERLTEMETFKKNSEPGMSQQELEPSADDIEMDSCRESHSLINTSADNDINSISIANDSMHVLDES